MKKRLFAIMLALALVLAAVPALAEEGAVEQDNTAVKKICTTEGCSNEVTNEGDFCADCAAKKAEEEAARKAAEEEAAKKAAEEEAARKAAEEQKITEEETAKKSPRLLGETSAEGAGTVSGCNHEHTPAYNGTMVLHAPTKPTCAKEGNIGYYQCNKCGKYFKKDGSNNTNEKPAIEINLGDTVIPKTNVHTLGEKVTEKAATCTEDGNIEYYECSVCEGKFADSTGMHTVDNIVIPALGHTISEDVTYKQKPTCTKAGIATYTCGRCGASQENVNVPAMGHDYGEPTWNWCGVSSATATFRCKRNCGEENSIVTCPAKLTRNGINSCGYYTYTATVKFNGKTYTDTRTDYGCRPDWYYDDCYYRNTCGHWGCGDVCTRYSNCVPCQNYRTTFRVGGYNCLATPKTGDVSVIGMALISLAGAGAAVMSKKRK